MSIVTIVCVFNGSWGDLAGFKTIEGITLEM